MVAVRPGPPDARIPCPLCGDLIHPVAGKCKHCKADLTAYRAARPAANAPLPALNHAAPSNGQIHAPTAHAVPPPHDMPQPVLPPRPTARAATVPSGTWRSWPIVVIIVAMMAIVAAVVLMMWPTHRDRDGTRLKPPPAPERMDTQTPPVMPRIEPPAPRPAPQAAPQDPWSPQPSDPPHTPGAAQADPDDASDLDGIDPFDAPHSGHRLTLNTGGQVALAVIARLCHKLATCGGSAATQTTCDAILRLPSAPPSSCPTLQRCLRQIDNLDCMPDLMRTGMQLLQLGDCADAVRC